MKLLLDTNILIFLSKDPGFQLLTKIINPDNQQLFVSIASIAELKSIALQNKWSTKKWQIIKFILDEAVVIEVNETLTDIYAEIDSFSQRRNPSFTKYDFDTPRNMGKNDIWIASSAALFGLKLVTTDADFNHLQNVFIEIQRHTPDQLLKR